MIRASFCIYHFSSVIDFSSERYIVSTGHRYSWYQQRKYSKDTKRKLELTTRSRNRKFFPIVGRYFLIIFLSPITRILEGEETLKKSIIPQDNYWKSPMSLAIAGYSFPCEVVCCRYFPVRLQSQIIDDYGIMSCNSVICFPINFRRTEKKSNTRHTIGKAFLGPIVNEGVLNK